jgi:glycosyltransferase involved in cell wall biosynthesis
MNVLQVNNFHYLRGGDARYMFDLSNMLKKNGHSVSFFSMRHDNNFRYEHDNLFIDNIDYAEINRNKNILNAIKVIKTSYWNVSAQRNISELIKLCKPDVAHLHSILHHITPSIIRTLKQNNVPVIMHLHDYNLLCPDIYLFRNNKICEECFNNKFYNCIRYRCKKKSLSASIIASSQRYFHNLINILDDVDVFIAPTKFTMEVFKRGGFKFIDRVRTVPHFTSGEKGGNYIPNSNGIVFAGRFIEEKGIKLLLSAAKELKDIPFCLIGDGPLLQYIRNFIDENHLNNIRVVDWLNKEELIDEVCKYSCVVMPSIWYETSGLSVLEAGSIGIPVIVSDNTAMTELISSEDGIIFKMGDIDSLIEAILKITFDLDLQKQLSSNLRNKILNEYNPEQHYSKIIEIYNSARKRN